jgi:aerobic-type carbon monoxide dehydrogenase small subunit (CoxS/CutS family)
VTETRTVGLQVNGRRHERETEVRTSLADFLRHDLGYTGTHVACEQGVCGSCTVLVDEVAVRSCLMLAVQADGSEVTTVESLGRPDQLSALQESMRQEHGLQCGFCTPGLLMGVLGEARAGRDLDDVLESVLTGHLCRCTGYVNIRAAIMRAWPELKQA